MSRIFITGSGVINALGLSVDDSWQAIVDQRSGIGKVRQWDLSEFACPWGAEVSVPNLRQLLPDKKLLKLLSRQDVLGLYAADQAISASGCLQARTTLSDADDFNYRSGIFVGSPGNKFFQQYDFLPLMAKAQGDMPVFADHLFEQVHPMWLLKILPNNVLAYTGIRHQLKGHNQNITNHAVGGMQALFEAYHAIKQGNIDRAVVIAYDLGFEPQAQSYYNKLGLLSHSGRLAPFDQQADGTILGEGAVALVLERESVARHGDHQPVLELVTVDTNSEAQGIFAIERDAKALTTLLQTVTHRVTKSPEVVVAHANGNALSDLSEAQALVDSGLSEAIVTGFKWAYGHTLCAAGLMDTVMACRMLSEAKVTALPTCQQIATHCPPIRIADTTVNLPTLSSAMIISRGFGGLNAAALIKRHG